MWLKDKDIYTIGLVAPSSPITEAQLEEVCDFLISQGFKVKCANNLTTFNGYLAGSDEIRAQELLNIWLDEEVDIVWAVRGGFGVTRILELLDFSALAKHPKPFIGHSDNTALEIALYQEAALKSIMGPGIATLIKDKALASSYSFSSIIELLMKTRSPLAISYPDNFSYPLHVIKPGIAKGILVGGNLSMITSLIGTPWELQTQEKILILEDVNEKPYKVDRMLRQLKQSGALTHLKGVVLATFHDCSVEDMSKSFSLEQIFNEYFLDATYPVAMGFPIGHIKDSTALIYGAEYELSIQDTISLKLLNAKCSLSQQLIS